MYSVRFYHDEKNPGGIIAEGNIKNKIPKGQNIWKTLQEYIKIDMCNKPIKNVDNVMFL